MAKSSLLPRCVGLPPWLSLDFGAVHLVALAGLAPPASRPDYPRQPPKFFIHQLGTWHQDSTPRHLTFGVGKGEIEPFAASDPRRSSQVKGKMASQELPPLPSLPPTREANLEEWQPTRQIQSPFFRLPPELRQMILHAAFGDRTIHMDLRFRPPLFAPQTGDKGGPDPVHGGFPPLVDSHEGAIPSLVWHPRADAVMAWRWYSCLCHRNPPEARGTPLWQQPCLDRCLYGQGSCSSFPGEFPAKCMVGVMGFLLSCKRA
jgi:hypothetical protein